MQQGGRKGLIGGVSRLTTGLLRSGQPVPAVFPVRRILRQVRQPLGERGEHRLQQRRVKQRFHRIPTQIQAIAQGQRLSVQPNLRSLGHAANEPAQRFGIQRLSGRFIAQQTGEYHRHQHRLPTMARQFA